jgi:hypothetical protein
MTISERFDEVIEGLRDSQRMCLPPEPVDVEELKQLKADVEAVLKIHPCHHPNRIHSECLGLHCVHEDDSGAQCWDLGGWDVCEYGGRYQP